MLLRMSSQYNKVIAWILLLLFYSDFVAAKFVFQSRVTDRKAAYSYSAYQNTGYHAYAQESYGSEIGKVSSDAWNNILNEPTNSEMEIDEADMAGPGPGQPEMSSFKSVGSDNMVDLFSGNFSYNIPLGDVGGYPINIFYNSGITMDQEASWVGLGWNLNPGTIMRNVRGVPDDFNGEDKIRTSVSLKDNITVGVKGDRSTEFVGKEIQKSIADEIREANFFSNASAGIFYNNYRGLGLEFGKSKTFLTLWKNTNDHCATTQANATLAVSMNLNSQTGVNVNPSLSIKRFDDVNLISHGLTLSAGYNSRIGLQSLSLHGEVKKYSLHSYGDNNFRDDAGGSIFGSTGSLSFSSPSITPSIRIPLTNSNYNLGFKWGNERLPFFTRTYHLSGYFRKSKIAKEDEKQVKPAFGYLYYQQANGNKDAMLDFNRLNDVVYTKNNPTIAIPNYTYDVYTISGEGTGGSFRPYRGDIGYVHDNYTRTRDHAASIDIDLGVEDIVKVGLNLDFVRTPNTVGEWSSGNIAGAALKFRGSKGSFQAAYFKNPGERAIVNNDYLQSIGNDKLMRLKLENSFGDAEPPIVPVWEIFNNDRSLNSQQSFTSNDVVRVRNIKVADERDKRTQVISYLTAEEASVAGFNKQILYYPVNTFPKKCNQADAVPMSRYEIKSATSNPALQNQAVVIRKPHHISEISVLQADGRRYVYGIPVYNTSQEEASFNVAVGNSDKQLATYNPANLGKDDEGAGVKYNKDDFSQVDNLDPYAHSFLLTELLSPDYVDIKGDGVSDDDLGTAVKFNYSKLETESKKDFGWRAPFWDELNKAAYNEGLKTASNDQKAHYTYGTRELWYLNSIESKNMIATFTVMDRDDAKEALSKNGGRGSEGMKRLKEINIYSKPNWVKYGENAKPVKTIYFEYSNELCKYTPDNKWKNNGSVADVEKGKLTLKKIWFTYNGNNKAIRNRYQFNYTYNPDYNRTANDRWGNFKDPADNQLDGFSANNSDYPYALQEKNKADLNASAWSLSQINLPSGGSINVTYESDDYAYVQDRRAAQMFKIKGFASSADAPLSQVTNNLYSFNGGDNYYVYIEQTLENTDPYKAKEEIKAKYLDGVKQLFFKLYVKVPVDQYSTNEEYEPIPIYAKIDGDNYGKWGTRGFWVKIKPDNGYSPLFYSTVQFCIQHLPSKIYPGSDVRATPFALFKALYGMLSNLFSFVGTFYGTLRLKGWCKQVDLANSFVRLNNPGFCKLGGGLRVKRIEINDNWNQLTVKPGKTPSPNATYGQEYEYKTTQLVNGSTKEISSGVATYEPIVGAEENPFREILNYDDNQPMGPAQRSAIELPLGEVFFPSPSVGYSKVTVRSIHRNNIKSATGKAVTEFYTAKDFPVISDYTNLEPGKSHVRFQSSKVLSFLNIDVREKNTLSQGFRIQLNDMNGKIKSTSSFAQDNSLITYTENQYRVTKGTDQSYNFNNKVPVILKPDAVISEMQIGKEVEVMTDVREHNSKAVTFNTDLNFHLDEVGWIPLPAFSIIPPVYYAETQYRSVSVLKVVNNYGILENVKHIDKGSEVNASDLVYDGETGNVLLSSSSNEYNRPVYKFNYPAHWAYREMQGAYKNIDAVYDGVRFQNGKITTPGFDFSLIESGDEIYVKDYSSNGAVNEPGCYPSGSVEYIPKPTDGEGAFVRRIWAIDLAKDPDNTYAQNLEDKDRKFIFIDKDGQPYSGGDVYMRIVRSGRRNLTDASAGGFTCLKDPRTPVAPGSAVLSVKANDASAIINTTAATYKEKWRVEKLFFAERFEEAVKKFAPVHKVVLRPHQLHLVKGFQKHSGSNGPLSPAGFVPEFFQHENVPGKFVTGSSDNEFDIGGQRFFTRIKSWMKFNFNNIPAGSKVKSAKLVLMADTENSSSHSSDGISHTAVNPHSKGGWENESSYNLRVSPMEHSWDDYLGLTEPTWEQLFYETTAEGGISIPSRDVNWENLPGIGYASDKSFYIDNASNLAQRLIDNKYERGYASAIFIDHSSRHVGGNRFCFTGSCVPGLGVEVMRPIQPVPPTAPPPPPPASEECTRFEIAYYNCSEARNEDEFAPGDEKVECEILTVENVRCVSAYTKEIINPYTYGSLGNWRPDKSYAYYGERREQSTAQKTKPLSHTGAIVNYMPFWINSTNGLMSVSPAATTSAVNTPAWNWTSESTQFNSKGFELENRDPAGRYNCGIYGYNEGLPVAVANNSKVRESAFDGFEDYGFENSNCSQLCKPVRHLVIDNISNYLSDKESHTGNHSVKVLPGQSMLITVPVVDKISDEKGYEVDIKTVTTTMDGTWVNPRGTGLRGTYRTLTGWPPVMGYINWVNHVLNNYNDFTDQDDVQVNLHYQDGTYHTPITPPGSIGPENFVAKWNGYLQPPVSGVYELSVTSDDGFVVEIDYGSGWEYLYNDWSIHGITTVYGISTQSLTAGQTYPIRIRYFQQFGEAVAKIAWKLPNTPSPVDYQLIPSQYLYLPDRRTDASGTVVTGEHTCIKPARVNVKDNAFIDKFSPLQNKKMLLSIWVRETEPDCKPLTYNKNSLEISFEHTDNTTTGLPVFMPTGNIIDGWQRYEAAFTIPADANALKIKLNSDPANTEPVYWDDLRIHPYNSNLKSFVYNKNNLRLMAELDENNYSSFFEYDDDGTLVRVKKETTDGIKTITETRSSLQKKIIN